MKPEIREMTQDEMLAHMMGSTGEINKLRLSPASGAGRDLSHITVDLKTSPAVGREEILDGAKECVLKDRQETHGDPENSFATIAEYWSAHLGVKISATDVTIMMTLLKVARLKVAPGNKDNWVDMAGYAACGGEIALNQ